MATNRRDEIVELQHVVLDQHLTATGWIDASIKTPPIGKMVVVFCDRVNTPVIGYVSPQSKVANKAIWRVPYLNGAVVLFWADCLPRPYPTPYLEERRLRFEEDTSTRS